LKASRSLVARLDALSNTHLPVVSNKVIRNTIPRYDTEKEIEKGSIVSFITEILY
jgi:hypothetical protein